MSRNRSPLFPVLAVGAAFATGCGGYRLSAPAKVAYHRATPPPADAAKVCVLRTTVLANAVTFAVRDNGTLVGATRGPTHFCYEAEPGDHLLEVDGDEVVKTSLRAEAGRSYYLHQKIDFFFGVVKCRPEWVEEAAAQPLFDDSIYRVLTAVPEGQTLPPEPPRAAAAATPATATPESP